MERRVAFVTGASRGIGKGIASELLSRGYCVAAAYNTNRELAEKAFGNKENAHIVRVDISKRDSIKDAITRTEKYFKKTVDILVNNAAIAQEKPFEEISDADWDTLFSINLRGAFAFSQEVIGKMAKRKWGRIINVTSIGGQWGGINQIHYAVSKAGLIGLTRSLAKAYSSVGITTNAIAIGLVKTDMTKKELKSKKGIEKIKNIPIGRIAEVKDISGIVAFLCSNEASYITGQTINANGGMYFG
jgi:NAD(P)-dependent dehydrogenase (short-subunit alcohol dehydrogenase family)